MLLPLFSLLSRGKLTVLLFHKVPQKPHCLVPDELDLAGFERVLQTTMQLFRVIPLEDALMGLRNDKLPPRAACITFDDGYPDWLNGVVPILERRGAHATFFITTGQFAGVPMWNERILHAINSAPEGLSPLSWEGFPSITLGMRKDRPQNLQRLEAFLKYQEPATKEYLLVDLERHSGVDTAQVSTMSVNDLRNLHAKGFGIGGHSMTHPILSRCTSKQAFEEIAGARETLESLIRGKVSGFAYPNGVPGKDFGSEHIEMVRHAGYSYAVTTQRGFAAAHTSPLQIPRFTPWGPTPWRMDVQFLRNLLYAGHTLTENDGPWTLSQK